MITNQNHMVSIQRLKINDGALGWEKFKKYFAIFLKTEIDNLHI